MAVPGDLDPAIWCADPTASHFLKLNLVFLHSLSPKGRTPRGPVVEVLLIIDLALTVVVGAVVAFELIRAGSRAQPGISPDAADKLAAAQRDEFSRARLENAEAARLLREEVATGLKAAVDMFGQGAADVERVQREQFESFATQLLKSADVTRAEAEGLRKEVRDSLQGVTTSLLDTDRAQRTEISDALKSGAEAVASRTAELQQIQKDQLSAFSNQLTKSLEAARSESAEFRKEVTDSMRTAAETLQRVGNESGATQREIAESNAKQLHQLTESNVARVDALKTAVEEQLTRMQLENAKKLDEMRQTVDEKLHGTLERRLGESFKLVSDKLDQVHAGLGEMRTLATSVGDLKRTLTNVATRGVWAEVQLEALIDQFLTADQYERNVETRAGSGERVEFALRLPGRDRHETVLLPIDAKFPREDYERLAAAEERGDAEASEDARRELEHRLKTAAKHIKDKYLNVPATTNFAIMFLPTEGLYAETLRRPGLVDSLQRDFGVMVAGPTNVAAILNIVQMGFKTLAIEKRSSEVWQLLSAVKGEFQKYAAVLGKVQTKLSEASETIDMEVARRARVIQRKLRDVESLPAGEAEALLGLHPQALLEQNDDLEPFDDGAPLPPDDVNGDLMVRTCVVCDAEFTQVRRQGRPFEKCEKCRPQAHAPLVDFVVEPDASVGPDQPGVAPPSPDN